ncbi:DNA polymerase III subunit alpha [Candidatus Kinetoplastibacterium desouzaii TCC079E]|uniref:DNA polymerase III subunit alpha n=1 Tax=Candidatus Kinetoplastidibacterium desouzai TCC079E TaxID=1208919 RepID=M1LM10_9PROT|nr:DNA polymerase III subunit alpha [Candidatus Kinetoplastibacterium desouzaii]AGF46752.1 DNA polymerase III subunit alpha [Candidatus Kinetoplastibacterium desouzaii TCC079E]
MLENSKKSVSFVHLRVHSEYSIVDGLIKINDLVDGVIKLKQPAVALTDLSNLFGALKFYKYSRSRGIKPVIGCDVWLSNDEDKSKPHRILILVRNNAGYLNLCNLITKSYLTNQTDGRVEIRKEWLVSQEGLIILSGGIHGDVGHALRSGRKDLALSLIKQWKFMFPDSYYIEIQRSGLSEEEEYIQLVVPISSDENIPIVATHPVEFLEKSHFKSHEVRVCIADGKHLTDVNKNHFFTEKQYLLSSEEMIDLFADIPSALSNSIEIAKRCNINLQIGKPMLPNFEVRDDISLEFYLKQLSSSGLTKKLNSIYPESNDEFKSIYYERLDKECKTIIQMGFAGYFLIVQDFINWAKNNGVPVGPGRGSGAGSLVAYSLGITDLDPIKYDLLFERFLNPERVSMPDFDIDFCPDNRDRVIDYVKNKYGSDSVSQIVTFGTFGAKAVIRDVGRVLGLPYSLCDSLSKLIPFNPVDQWSLERVINSEPSFKSRYNQEEEVKNLVDLAMPLEGLVRNVGMHAGGVLIAPGKLTDFCPLYCQPGQETSIVSQFDKDDVELAGLVKFDFLGLRNLTVLDWAVRYVRSFNKDEKDFDLANLELDDKLTYNLLCNGNTTAVFQLESKGMKDLLKRLKPNTFEDIIAVLALYRPGPLESGMVNDFVNRKHGLSTINYFHPILESILKSTYGVIVYQEQVMLISQVVGGYSLGGADLLRRAMGKKDPEEMSRHRVLFEKGAVNKGYSPHLAIKLFDLMEKFAGYGFNKSHSAAYALIAYQTAWLKAHYPSEFFAASMSSDMDDTDKIKVLFNDAKNNSIDILPPDINLSNFRFEPINSHSIRYGLGAIKGVGKSAIEEIVKIRELAGNFKSLFDFCYRASKIINRRSIESLVKSGAFDSLDPNRAFLFSSLDIAINAADQKQRNRNQSSLFDSAEEAVVDVSIKDSVINWDLHKKLIEEKSALGYYFSDHLFNCWGKEIRRAMPKKLIDVEPHAKAQFICGVLVSIRSVITRRGKIVIALLDDATKQLEVAIYAEIYSEYRDFLKEDNLIAIKGIVSKDDYSGNIRIVAEKVLDLQAIRILMAKSLVLHIKDNVIDTASIRSIIEKHNSYINNKESLVSIFVFYENNVKKFSCKVKLGDRWMVVITDNLLSELKNLIGSDFIDIVY